MSTPTRGERVYRVLLRLFPRDFQRRFAQDMTELFRDRVRATQLSRGRLALVPLWARTILDVLSQSAAARYEAARARPPYDSPLGLASRARKDPFMAPFIQDLRYALAGLRRQPTFTLIAVLTLALGIGANTAIFSIVNAVLLKPLPYPGAERLVWLYSTTAKGEEMAVSLPNLRDWLERSRSLEAGGAWVSQSMNLTGRETPDRLRGAFVTSGLLDLLGVKPILGRSLTPEEDRAGAAPVVVLQYDTWQRRFAGNPAIVGTTLLLNNIAHTVVGVMPPKFSFLMDDDVECWVPASTRGATVTTDRADRDFLAFGRLRAGVSMAQARADLATVGEAMARLDPVVNAGRGVSLERFPDRMVTDTRQRLLVLFGAVACVLLIACVNLANLLLARGAGRTRELALRAALGASRGRLFRQLLTESLVLAGAGGVAGLLLAYWGVRALSTMVVTAPGSLIDRVAVDGQVMLFALALSLGTGVLFGLLPGLRLSRANLQQTLRSGGRGSDDHTGHWIRGALVVSEVALSLMLLVGAGLLVRSLFNLLDRSPGFNAEHVLSLEYRLPRNKYTDDASQWRFHEQVIERVRQVPGVTEAALVRGLAFSGNSGETEFSIAGKTAGDGPDQWPSALFNTITSDYFRTMQIPIRQGRSCDVTDSPDGPRVAVINDTLARQYWPDGTAIGQVITVRGLKPATIVGVVGGTLTRELTEAQRPQIYDCYAQSAGTFATLVARTAGDPMSVAEAVKAAIWSVDRDQPVWKVRSAQWLLDRNVAPARLTMGLMGGAAGLALLLAVIGIYGVMSYAVSQRTREIGVRMALGAERRDIARLILRHGLLLTVAGVAIGWIGARWIAGLLQTMLVDVAATDGATYAGVALLLTVVALAACGLPARRATRVDPVRSLRAD